MKKIELYTKGYCPYCKKAAAILEKKKVEFVEIDVTDDQECLDKARETSNCRTVPQLFIDGEFIGGHDDMVALDKRGELDKKLGI
jgi:glutaredoxin 3